MPSGVHASFAGKDLHTQTDFLKKFSVCVRFYSFCLLVQHSPPVAFLVSWLPCLLGLLGSFRGPWLPWLPWPPSLPPYLSPSLPPSLASLAPPLASSPGLLGPLGSLRGLLGSLAPSLFLWFHDLLSWPLKGAGSVAGLSSTRVWCVQVLVYSSSRVGPEMATCADRRWM